LVSLQPARITDRGGDVLSGDRPEQASVGACLLGDRYNRLVQQRSVLARFLGVLALGALGRFLALANDFDRAFGGRLGQLARDQEVAQVSLGDVDDCALLAECVDVLEKYRFGHLRSLTVPVPVTAFAARVVVAATLVDVGQQRQLPRPLDRARYLALMAPACTGDPA